MSYGGYAGLWAHARGERKHREDAMDEDGLKKFNAIEARIQKGLERDTSFLEKVRADAEAERKEWEALRRFAIDLGKTIEWIVTVNTTPSMYGPLLGRDQMSPEIRDRFDGMLAAMKALGGGEPKPDPAPSDKTVAECPCPACVEARGDRGPADRARLEADAAKLMGATASSPPRNVLRARVEKAISEAGPEAQASYAAGQLVESVLDRATAAVRDEAGSRLCAWVDRAGKVSKEGERTLVCTADVVTEELGGLSGSGTCLCRQVALAVIDVLEPGDLDMVVTPGLVHKAALAMVDRWKLGVPDALHAKAGALAQAALDAVARKPSTPNVSPTNEEALAKMLADPSDGVMYIGNPSGDRPWWPFDDAEHPAPTDQDAAFLGYGPDSDGPEMVTWVGGSIGWMSECACDPIREPEKWHWQPLPAIPRP